MAIWWAFILVCYFCIYLDNKVKKLESKLENLDSSRRGNYIPDYFDEDED